MRAKINLGLLLNDLNAVSSNQFFIRADLLKSEINLALIAFIF